MALRPVSPLRHVGHFLHVFIDALRQPSQKTCPQLVALRGLTSGGSKQMAHLILDGPGGGAGSGGTDDEKCEKRDLGLSDVAGVSFITCRFEFEGGLFLEMLDNDCEEEDEEDEEDEGDDEDPRKMGEYKLKRFDAKT